MGVSSPEKMSMCFQNMVWRSYLKRVLCFIFWEVFGGLF
jgi:hypothetical protein